MKPSPADDDEDDDEGECPPVRLSIARLLAEWGGPFEHPVWDLDEPITREEVGAAIMDGAYLKANQPYEDVHEYASRDYHIQRVAYLAINGWADHIVVDLGIPAFGLHVTWPIQDGNHRFAAAIFRGDKSIFASVGGQTDWIETFVEAEGSNATDPA